MCLCGKKTFAPSGPQGKGSVKIYIDSSPVKCNIISSATTMWCEPGMQKFMTMIFIKGKPGKMQILGQAANFYSGLGSFIGKIRSIAGGNFLKW